MSTEFKQGRNQPKLRFVPCDWEETTIGSVTTWLSGGTPSRKIASFWAGSIPWISGSTLKNIEISKSDQFLTPEAVVSGSKMAPLNSTLLLVRGSALHNEIRAGVVVAPVAFNQDVKSLIPKNDVHPKYLSYYILGMSEELLKLVSSAGNSAGVLDTKLVQDFTLLKPSLEEQAKIVSALTDMDDLISGLDQIISKKRDIQQATMQQLLTGQRRLPGFSDEWEETRLGDCLLANPNYGINAPAVEYSDALPTYIRITDINDDGYFAPLPRVSVDSPMSGDYLLEEGDVVFARTGASVGKSYRYSTDDGPLVFAGFLIRVRPNQRKLIPAFLAASVTTKPYWNWVRLMSMRSGQPGINANEYASYTLLLPSIEEQSAISTILSDMGAEIATLEAHRNKARQLKQGMMQELLTGRTRLIDKVSL